MTDRQLECIALIAKHQSLTKAAKELFVSQSSLSQMLSKTEKELGVQLFERTATSMIPTYAGEMYIKAASEISEIKKQLEEMIAGVENSRQGRITIAMSSNRSALYMPSIIPAYIRRFPQVEVIFAEEDKKSLEDMVLSGKADVAIVTHPQMHEELEYRYLCREYLSLVLPIAWGCPHMLKGGKDADLASLADKKFVLIKSGHDIRDLTDRAFSDAHMVPHILLESHKLEVVFQLAANGIGATLVPDTYVRKHVNRNCVQCYSIGENYSRQVALVYRKRSHYPLILTDFINIASDIIMQLHNDTVR